jgi:hypothetical protein
VVNDAPQSAVDREHHRGESGLMGLNIAKPDVEALSIVHQR